PRSFQRIVERLDRDLVRVIRRRHRPPDFPAQLSLSPTREAAVAAVPEILPDDRHGLRVGLEPVVEALPTRVPVEALLSDPRARPGFVRPDAPAAAGAEAADEQA